MSEGYDHGITRTLQPGKADADLDNLIRSYRVTARAEGKSLKTIAIMATAPILLTGIWPLFNS